ncbi:MAG: hypothetical protein AMJ69_00410 [Gammaproteobacteria bacterium SG8_47]|nr:MAG: hypothetical protein AMJ69_00410 [Gammaproteobacteria bacterium SG8_47]
MGGQYFSSAGAFLISTIFGLYILAVMLRFLFQWARADFYNPVSQVIVKVTNPVLRPLRRIIPGWAGVDFAAVALMVALKCVELTLLFSLHGPKIPQVAGLLVLALAGLLSLLLNVFFFSILIQVILSWVNPGHYNPVTQLLYQLNEPILRPARRLIPPLGGFDLSPIVAFVAIKLLEFLLVAPINDLGYQLG